jgi:hypothetical protein
VSSAVPTNGFEVAEALEPDPDRGVQIAEVVRIANFLEPPASASPVEVDRSARAVGSAAAHDDELLSEACDHARRLVAVGQYARGVVELLSKARGDSSTPGAAAHQRITVTQRHDRLVLAVDGALTGELGKQLVEAVDAAVAVAPAVAVDLGGVHEWTADGLACLDQCTKRGAEIQDS